MNVLDEPLASLVLKLERAKEHILELEAQYDSFIGDNSYRIDSKMDSQTKERIHYLADLKPIPKSFSLILGDALHNLRSCLDHAVYAMVQVGNPSAVRTNDIYFPICNSATEYKARFGKRIEPGLRPDAVKALNGVAPYMGGAGEYFCHLSALNNLDKHRLLLTIVGCIEGHTMLPSQRKWAAEFHSKDPSELRHSFTSNRVSLLEVGDEILRVPETEVEEKMQFMMGISFAEPEICKGDPVIETLHELRKVILRAFSSPPDALRS